ncbi:[protein-PII] uridylyltransferase [Sessilibacter sp. MAH1]
MSIPHFEEPLIFFDQEKFRHNLESSDNKISVFKAAISQTNAHFDHRFSQGDPIRRLIYERALFVDCLLHYAWHQFEWSEQCGLIAVGGYGRGQLHPYSDIDILILFEEDNIESASKSIEGFVMLLWDIGLDIGHSVRTIEQCTKLASNDITIITNLMECRSIVGKPHLVSMLKDAVSPDVVWPAREFFKAKLAEQEKRHQKFNFTEYNLEPNIKNAPGGLRDIQTLVWVTKRFFGVDSINQLEGQDVITSRELSILNGGEEFLWKVRYGLHLLAGRPEERLLFNYQTELATMFGYSNSEKRLAVEQFMQWYYRVVLSLRELNDVLLQFLSEAILDKGVPEEIIPINDRFQLNNNFIEVTNNKVFERYPSALLEIFVHMGNNPKIQGVRASTIRLIRASRNLIDDEFRATPLHQSLFIAILRAPFDLFTLLRRMKRYGVLGRYLPEFGRITGQMQHDLFHIYTVDAHTLQLVKMLQHFSQAESKDSYPIAHYIYRNLPKPELLYMAGLYHDIAKGRGGDHSQLGAKDAYDFCTRHNVNRRDTNLIVWLVENHLMMSSVSQKQDISDPDVIHNFAIEVADQYRLDYLYTLTVADMNATNPTIWNNWRASLMRQLYMETKRILRRGLENPVDRQDLIDETQQSALAKLADKKLSKDKALTIWADISEDYFVRESHIDIAWQTQAVADAEDPSLVVAFSQTSTFHVEGATQIFIRTLDRKNVFATAALTLDHLNLNIQEARIYTSDTGITLINFYVLDQQGNPIERDKKTLKKIHDSLVREISVGLEDSTSIHRRTPRVLKHFRMPTQTSINNDLVSGQTLLEVISPDRPGLLARIGRIFIDLNIHLNSARISTLGERVEDVFLLSDENGEPLSDPNVCAQLQKEIQSQLDQQTQEQDAKVLA